MDSALEILDRLERVLQRHLGRLPPAQRQAVEAEVMGLVRMVRTALPRELHHAAGLQEEAEAGLARAREEARRLILDAQAHARSLSEAGRSGSGPLRPAGPPGVDEARREAERLRRGADEYAAQVLQRLEAEVERVLAAIRRGREVLHTTETTERRGG
ncbi:MAG: hypothetical protein ACT4PY_15005 [Armatimonadota bacterium]